MDFRKLFQVAPGSSCQLDAIDPSFRGEYDNRADVADLIDENRHKLEKLQLSLYAERRRSVLICLQGIDASGKDGLIFQIMDSMNPQGCRVTSFKQPSAEESARDFLWRVHKEVPGRGWVGVFNRSHYEAVLVERVHNLVPEEVWRRRYAEINDFEKLLFANGTAIIKFFLHIDKDEQLSRFKDRLDDPLKRWKISESDYTERQLWDEYKVAYEDALSHCSTPQAPWYVIPANYKWFRDLAVSQIILDTLEALSIAEPVPTVDIEDIRRRYHQEVISARNNNLGHKAPARDD